MQHYMPHSFTDRLITVEREMLHFEKELHIVKLQPSSSGRSTSTTQTTTPVCPTAYCIDHTFSIITSTDSASSTHYKSGSPTELLNQSLICSPT